MAEHHLAHADQRLRQHRFGSLQVSDRLIHPSSIMLCFNLTNCSLSTFEPLEAHLLTMYHFRKRFQKLRSDANITVGKAGASDEAATGMDGSPAKPKAVSTPTRKKAVGAAAADRNGDETPTPSKKKRMTKKEKEEAAAMAAAQAENENMGMSMSGAVKDEDKAGAEAFGAAKFEDEE
jgi:hypothetical protein